MAAEKHSEPTMRMDIKICLPQRCTRVRHVWIWENFQTPPEGPRAGLKDSQIAYPCIGVVVPLPNQSNRSLIKTGPLRGQIVKCSNVLPRVEFAATRNRCTYFPPCQTRTPSPPRRLHILRMSPPPSIPRRSCLPWVYVYSPHCFLAKESSYRVPGSA